MHGDISINGTRLWTWSARRTQDPPEAVNMYDVELFDSKGVRVETWQAKHKYDAGALVLARKVLDIAARRIR